MAVDTLLLELGAEELPPTALDALSDAFWALWALISAEVAASAINAIDDCVACCEAASISLCAVSNDKLNCFALCNQAASCLSMTSDVFCSSAAVCLSTSP